MRLGEKGLARKKAFETIEKVGRQSERQIGTIVGKQSLPD
jgi:hypothetical protein